SSNQDRLGILAGREARVGRNHLVAIQNARPSGRVLYAGPVDVIDALRGRIAPHDRPTGEIPRADSKRDGRNERRASEEDFLQHASLQGREWSTRHAAWPLPAGSLDFVTPLRVRGTGRGRAKRAKRA